MVYFSFVAKSEQKGETDERRLIDVLCFAGGLSRV